MVARSPSPSPAATASRSWSSPDTRRPISWTLLRSTTAPGEWEASAAQASDGSGRRGAMFALDRSVIPPVLCYHKVERRRELGVTRLSPRRFAAQIQAMARAGWRALSLRDFTAIARGERRLRDRELLITFD